MDGIITDQMASFSPDPTTSNFVITSEIIEIRYSTDSIYELYTTIMETNDGSEIVTGPLNFSGSPVHHDDYVSVIPLPERVVEATLLSIIWLLAFWGNLLLWMVVFQKQSLRTITNAMVLCLSAADLLVSIVNLPFTIFTVAVGGQWIFGDLVCVILGYMNMLTFVASVMSLAAIGICRYLYICHSEIFRRVYTKRNTGWIIAGVWMFSGLLASPPLLGWGIYDYLPGQSFCFCQWTSSVSYTLFMIGVCFGGPCSVMTFCYVQILRVVRNSRKRVDSTIKRKSTVSVENKISMPPPVLKVPQTTSTITDNNKNDTHGQRSRGSSFTLSITSNSASGGSSGQTDVTTLSTQTYTATTQCDQMKPQESNILQVPSTSSHTRMEQVDEQDHQTGDNIDHQIEATAANAHQESVPDFPDKPPQLVTTELSSSSTNEEVPEKVKLRTKTQKRRNTGDNTTGSNLDSPPIEEDRPSLLNRLSKHGSVMKSIVSKRSNRKKSLDNERSRRRRQEELKLTKSFVVVIFCFIICWMPFCVAMFWSVFGKYPPPRIFDMGTLILGYFNSCCNPIIYGVMNNKFRAGYKAILCNACACAKGKSRTSLNSSLVDNEGSLTRKRFSQSLAAAPKDRSY